MERFEPVQFQLLKLAIEEGDASQDAPEETVEEFLQSARKHFYDPA